MHSQQVMMLPPSLGHVKNIYYFIHNPNNNQTLQDGIPACTNFILKIMMASLLLSYVTSNYGCINNSKPETLVT